MSSTPVPSSRKRVDAFLSHAYKAPAANLFAYDLNETAAIAFRVDRGVKHPTSTTRLERMIRDADAFVAFWSLTDEAAQDRETRLAHSQYFRLELDMALRARKPGIVFADKRYSGLVRTPELALVRFDPQEVALGRDAPGFERLGKDVERLWTDFTPLPRGEYDERRVGLLVPEAAAEAARATVEQADCAPVVLPHALTATAIAELRRCDWVVVDIAEPTLAPLAAYLHGQAMPLLRLSGPGGTPSAATADALFGDLTVGYRKDVTPWTTPEDLSAGLLARLQLILEERKLIGDRAGARAYFNESAVRDEPVFVSYANPDREVAAEFVARLKDRFAEVFDYRDGGSIPAGEPWFPQMRDSLGRAKVGVVLFSDAYEESVHCRFEADELAKAQIEGRAKVFAVRVGADAKPPVALKHLQYLRNSELGVDGCLERILAGL